MEKLKPLQVYSTEQLSSDHSYLIICESNDIELKKTVAAWLPPGIGLNAYFITPCLVVLCPDEAQMFGVAFRAARRTKGLTQGGVARILGLYASHVSMVERGQVAPFDDSQLKILSQTLGMHEGGLKALARASRAVMEAQRGPLVPVRKDSSGSPEEI